MEANKTDRRIKYTKMVIKNSLIKFLKQKPISKISVKEICEDADINRTTFYAHYLDQYDLFQQIEDEVINNINQYLKGYDFKDNKHIPVEMTAKILEYIEENSELFDLLLNSNGDIKFQQEVIKIVGRQHFISMIENDSLNKEDAEYIFHFLASGAVGVIQMWLKDGMKKSAMEMAELILKTAINGRSSIMSNDNC
jgi:AcrR family transcriptional regulator